YDGANIEILDAVGEDNFFLFGLRVEEIAHYRAHNDPNQIIAEDEDLNRVMKLLECGHFSMFEPGLFVPVIQSIRSPQDPWMIAADFRSYVDAQTRAALTYSDKSAWTKMSILNTAASGQF